MSKSKTRSVAAIGNSRVIPAQAGSKFGKGIAATWAPACAGATSLRQQRGKGGVLNTNPVPRPAITTPALRQTAAAWRLCIAAIIATFGPSFALAQVPALPKSPVTINVVDVAGDLALTQGAIEAYQAKHPNLVSKVTFSKAPAPELPAKLRAMQAAGRTDIDLVTDGSRRIVGRHRSGSLGQTASGIRGEVSGTARQLPARGAQDERSRAGRAGRLFHAAGPCLGHNPAKVKAGTGIGTPRVNRKAIGFALHTPAALAGISTCHFPGFQQVGVRRPVLRLREIVHLGRPRAGSLSSSPETSPRIRSSLTQDPDRCWPTMRRLPSVPGRCRCGPPACIALTFAEAPAPVAC